MPSLQKVDIYEITVDPDRSTIWEGLFNFEPNSEDVAAAIQAEINEINELDEFDELDEEEWDQIQALSLTLELVTCQNPKLSGEVRIAGTYVGKISLTIVKIFGREEQSMLNLPELRSDLVNRVPELTDTSELTDISELVQQRADAEQFGGELPGNYSSAEELFEHLNTDPRTGEAWPGKKIQTSEGEITLTESQRRNLASEHMRGDKDF
jgi:hypothetical protein